MLLWVDRSRADPILRRLPRIILVLRVQIKPNVLYFLLDKMTANGRFHCAEFQRAAARQLFLARFNGGLLFRRLFWRRL